MRYAIYYIPPPGTPLALFGAGVLGHDIAHGSECPRISLPGIDDSRLVRSTCRARRYGFHATLKAPFRLAPGASRIDLLRLAADTADRCLPVALPGLDVAVLGSFVALRPRCRCLPQLDAIAAAFVRDLEPLRAAEPDAKTKWPTGTLSPREQELLDVWGYPYTFDRWRFHMTLTDPLPLEEVADFCIALRNASDDVAGGPISIDTVAVVEEAAPAASFRMIARFRLRGLRRAQINQPSVGQS